MKQSIPKLRAVRFKNGGEVRLLPSQKTDGRKIVEKWVKEVISAHDGDIDGFAFVVWGKDLGSTAKSLSGPRSPLPAIYVPEFVKARLLAAKIEEWTIETIEKG